LTKTFIHDKLFLYISKEVRCAVL